MQSKSTLAGKEQVLQRPNPLISVILWELRRLVSNYINWGIVLAFFVFCLLVIGFKHSWGRPVVDGQVGETILIVGTSALGSSYQIIEGLLLFLGILLPFVAGEAIAGDYKARVHELLMSTSLPTWGYVFGRYIASLIVSFGLALVLLVAVLVTSPILHLTLSYPAPNLALILSVWVIAIIPATILVSSLSFALGTLLPRLAFLSKIALMALWVSLFFGSDVFDHGSTWFTLWNPTSYGIVRVNVDHFLQVYQAAVQNVSDIEQRAQLSIQLQQQVPNLAPWIPSHLVLVGLGVILAAVAALYFRRFRDVLG
ncbi:MAG TPA: hypothetical protein VFD70_30150 [Anaerolineae bacterium]|nr:hypothetical protein [Anaerolineae bacterium]